MRRYPIWKLYPDPEESAFSALLLPQLVMNPLSSQQLIFSVPQFEVSFLISKSVFELSLAVDPCAVVSKDEL